MTALDHLPWSDDFSVRPYGRTLAFRTNDRAALERLRAQMLPGWEMGRDPAPDYTFSLWVGPPARRRGVTNMHLLYGGTATLLRTAVLDRAVAELDRQLHLTVAQLAPGMLFVHAGVVVWQGRAILVPGHTGAGKSTLVRALVQAGAAYWSDDMAVLDEHCRVHPYPVPLRPRDEGAPVPAPELGWRPGREPVPVGLVACLPYRPGARFGHRDMTAGEATMELMQYTVTALRDGAVWMDRLPRLAAHARCVRGTRGEAEEAAAALRDLMSQEGA